jgi:ABC-type multidrug transport system fused ATPase/permease subunit
MLLNGFLFLTLLFDIAQARSLWLSAGSYDGRTYTRLFTAAIAVKAVTILLESVQKRRWLDWDSKDHSPEETAGLYGLGAFLWLNSLFLRGYNKILTLKDLYPLDQQMLAVKLEAALTQRVEVANWGGKPHALTKTLFRTLAAAYLLPVGPRIALMGFQLCQPFLIQALLDHLAQPEEANNSNIGKGLIGAAILIYGGIALSTAFYWYFQERAMYMARGSLAAAIYKKSTLARLDAADDSAAVTLMSTDVEKIRVGLLFLHEFWVNIIQAAIASWLLYRILGAAFAASIILVFVCLALSFLMARAASPTQKAWMERIQKRVGLTANVITNMKHLKISGLTVPVEASIQDLRHEELKAGGKFRMIQALTAILGQVPLSFAPVFTFAVTSRTLDVTTIFTSMSYLVLLATPLSFVLQLVPTFMAGLACLNRIQAFLEKEARTDFREFPEQPGNTEKHLPTTSEDTTRPAVRVVDGSFGWADGMFNLKNISATVPSQGLTIVVGPIASGKSTLCKALLGETPLHQGRVIMGQRFRKIGYCDQTPFLSNATIRENIIGFSPFNETRYRDVIDATQLSRDLTLFPQGDKTNIGSNGITLSGGQKQRVSIARALYTEADLLIFDDILSGLDADTEEQVFTRVFGPMGMLKQRDATVVLCTHSVRHMPAADHIIALSSEGTLVEEGNFADLMANQKYVHSLGVKASEESGSGASTPPVVEKVEASFELTRTATGHATQHDTDEADNPSQKSRATGDMAVYLHYARSIGYSWISIFLLAGLISGFFYNFPTVWLKFWAEDVGASAYPHHTNAYYIGLYSLFQVLCVLFFGVMLIVCLKFMIQVSGAALHKGLLAVVMTAPLSFFTRTDSGVVTNLFSQDMTIIDGELPIALINVVLDGFTTLGQAAIIATSSPWLAVSYPFLFAAIFGIQKFYLRTSRQLRLLDLEAKSPLYTHFLDTIKGLATFRAFAWTQASIAENNKLLDTSQRPAYLLAMIQRWLLFVLNVVVALLAVIVVTLATQLRANQGFTGASLVSIMSFGDMLANIVRMYTTLETSIGAVSRLKSFTDNTKPEDLPGEDVVPPDTWPSRGTIEIRNTSASYGDSQSVSVPDTESSGPGSPNALALRDLNLVIQPGEKVAICGRSGR